MTEENNELLGKYDIDFFERDLSELSIVLEKRQKCQFLKYYEILIEWNGFMNLTGITDFSDVMKKHFVDSLSIVRCLSVTDTNTMIDVGSGAGFPGIPLKIVFPHLQVTLLDSLQKRIHFLNKVIDRLGLTGIEAVHGRAEDFAKPDKMRSKYDLCVSRAVANLSTLSEYCIPFVRTGGIFASYKSEKISEELAYAKKAVSILGGVVRERIDFMLPGTEINRTIVIIEKKKETPKKYPRKAGLPSKEPIC